jgi:hypothetical protein
VGYCKDSREAVRLPEKWARSIQHRRLSSPSIRLQGYTKTSRSRGFQPMMAKELTTLRERCAKEAGDGHLELYNSTMR